MAYYSIEQYYEGDKPIDFIIPAEFSSRWLLFAFERIQKRRERTGNVYERATVADYRSFIREFQVADCRKSPSRKML